MTFQSQMKLGVLDDSQLLTYSYADKHYSKEGEFVPESASSFLSLLLDMAHQNTLDALWIVPGSVFSRRAKELTLQCGDVEVIGSKQRDGTPRFLLAWNKTGNTKSVKIAFPEHDNRWPWTQCHDAKPLLYSVLYLQDAIEHEVAWSPGHTGLDLLYGGLSNHKQWLTTPDLPDVVCDEHHFAKDMRWHRKLTARETGEGMFFHLFDKNSQYLAACTSANVGEGTPEHVVAEQGETLFRHHAIWNLKVPGIWKVGDTWLWTPEIEYLTQKNEGWTPHIAEAYVWPKYHQAMRWWGEHLWNARQALKQPGIPYAHIDARLLAYAAVKSIATQGLGWLAMKSPDNKFYRPDWWNQVVATAHKNMGFKLLQLAKKEMFPCYVNVDSIGIISEGEDIDCYTNVLLGRKALLGGFKHVRSVPVTSELILGFQGKFRAAQDVVNEVQG